MRSRLILLLVLFSTAFLGIAAAEGLPTQSSSAAGVTVKVTPRTLSGGAWEFEIAFDTHTQALNDDLVKTASLLADGKPLAPASWQGDPPGGHHRKGVVSFKPVSPMPQAIELQIRREGEAAPRTFRWELK
jgi:hypothetical protein